MDDDDVREPARPETRRKTDHQIFDEQIARASGKFIVQLGGLGILAALVMSAIALIVAAHRSNTTITVPAVQQPDRPVAARRPSSRAMHWASRSSSPARPEAVRPSGRA